MTAPTPTSGDSGYSRCILIGSSLLLRGHLILLDLAVGHNPFPDFDRLLCKTHVEPAERHASAAFLIGLRKFCRRSHRSETAGEIQERLFGEVAVAVVGEQSAIDFPLL